MDINTIYISSTNEHKLELLDIKTILHKKPISFPVKNELIVYYAFLYNLSTKKHLIKQFDGKFKQGDRIEIPSNYLFIQSIKTVFVNNDELDIINEIEHYYVELKNDVIDPTVYYKFNMLPENYVTELDGFEFHYDTEGIIYSQRNNVPSKEFDFDETDEKSFVIALVEYVESNGNNAKPVQDFITSWSNKVKIADKDFDDFLTRFLKRPKRPTQVHETLLLKTLKHLNDRVNRYQSFVSLRGMFPSFERITLDETTGESIHIVTDGEFIYASYNYPPTTETTGYWSDKVREIPHESYLYCKLSLAELDTFNCIVKRYVLFPETPKRRDTMKSNCFSKSIEDKELAVETQKALTEFVQQQLKLSVFGNNNKVKLLKSLDKEIINTLEKVINFLSGVQTDTSYDDIKQQVLLCFGYLMSLHENQAELDYVKTEIKYRFNYEISYENVADSSVVVTLTYFSTINTGLEIDDEPNITRREFSKSSTDTTQLFIQDFFRADYAFWSRAYNTEKIDMSYLSNVLTSYFTKQLIDSSYQIRETEWSPLFKYFLVFLTGFVLYIALRLSKDEISDDVVTSVFNKMSEDLNIPLRQATLLWNAVQKYVKTDSSFGELTTNTTLIEPNPTSFFYPQCRIGDYVDLPKSKIDDYIGPLTRREQYYINTLSEKDYMRRYTTIVEKESTSKQADFFIHIAKSVIKHVRDDTTQSKFGFIATFSTAFIATILFVQNTRDGGKVKAKKSKRKKSKGQKKRVKKTATPVKSKKRRVRGSPKKVRKPRSEDGGFLVETPITPFNTCKVFKAL
jgi:hypothetical protein